MLCPHAHQQNGAAERKHRHIVEVGLALLAHASIPLKYWEDAFVAATYLINRTPSRVINYETPLERLFQQKPDYSSLRVFGCACWPNLRPYNTHKFQFRSKQCVFLGYSPLHKGFKCLDPSTGRVYISRDVTFDENVFPFSQLHDHAGARLKAEVKCLHPSLLNSDYGGEQVDDQYTNRPRDIANNVVEFAEQELHPSVQQDSGGDVLPHVPPGSEHEVDFPGLQHTESAPPSASSDESGGGRSQSAPCGESGGGRCAAPVRGDPTCAATESEDATCAPGLSTMPRNLRLSSEGK